MVVHSTHAPSLRDDAEMGFLGVYTALYDYEPQAEGELAINEGDVLYVVEKSEDDGWWKAKKKAGVEDEDEPVGLVPNNYMEEVCSIKKQRSIPLDVFHIDP